MQVTFVNRCGGWIFMRVETDVACIQIDLTSTFPPFPELYTWLGRIRDRQLPAKMMINEEGYSSSLIAKQLENNTIEFSIADYKYNNPDDIYLKTIVKSSALIKLFHNAITTSIEKEGNESEPSFIIGYNYLNWNALLKQPAKPHDWHKRLAIYGGGEGCHNETNLDTVQLSLQQKYIVKLREALANARRLCYISTRQKFQPFLTLIELYEELAVDLALDSIDTDWYEQQEKRLKAQCQHDKHPKWKNRKERIEEHQKIVKIRQARLKTLQIGQVVDGTIIGIRPYGLFVNIGGYGALLHISYISQLEIENIEEVFQPNDWIRAIIEDISFEKGRVLLSTKDLESEPGQMLKEPIAVYNNAAKLRKNGTINI